MLLAKITKHQWLQIEKRVLAPSDKWTSTWHHTMLNGSRATREILSCNGVPFVVLEVAINHSKSNVYIVKGQQRH